MDIRITPLAKITVIAKPKLKSTLKSIQELNYPRFTAEKKLKHPAQTTFITGKKIPNDHFLILSKKESNRPQLNVKPLFSENHLSTLTNKRGVNRVLLYQKIENNKQLHGAELVNRFNYKV